ncbi:MAG: VUT family protein [Rhodocyclaceae bacterium]|nr:VUT family protein [Rhodocyclaceae bacterium]
MYIVLYLLAIVLANISVARFGPSVAIVNAFLFIGLDLTARDKLHETWRGNGLLWKMAMLIAAGSVLSWVLNRNAGPIALASFVAFAAAASVDAAVYHKLLHMPKWARVNGSNIPAALVDSIVFPVIAFGWPPLLWLIVGQFLAKVVGGFVWSVILLSQKLKFERA